MKEFLRFEWKKTILPFILILLFFYALSVIYPVVKQMDDYVCEVISLNTEITKAISANDTLSAKVAAEKIKVLMEKNGVEKRMDQIDKNEWLMNMLVYDPLFPLPCEFSSAKFCRYYVSKETYDCFSNIEMPENSLFALRMTEYVSFSVWDVLINTLFLFTAGYLISSSALSGYRFIIQRFQKK